MKARIYYLIYMSSASRSFSSDELFEMLPDFRKHNAQEDITGMLLYKNGCFQQFIEGPEEAVKSLYARIHLDARHRSVITVNEGFEDKRQFSEWSMGFCDLDSADVANIPGYSQYLNTPLSDKQFASNPDLGPKFMRMFKNFGQK